MIIGEKSMKEIEETSGQRFAREHPEIWQLMLKGYTKERAIALLKSEEFQLKIEETARLLANDRISSLKDELYPLIIKVQESHQQISNSLTKVEGKETEYTREVRQRIDMDIEALVKKYVRSEFAELHKEYDVIQETQDSIDSLMDALFEKLEKLARKKKSEF
jgi:hypothetical protein